MQPNQTHHRLLTVSEAAMELGVSRSTTWRLIKDGSLPVVRVRSRGVRIKPCDLDRLLEAGK